MNTYSQKDVFRTAFQYIDNKEHNGFAASLPNGINQVCICCKAGSVTESGDVIGKVDKIIDVVDLKPWIDFYSSGTKDYAVYKCGSCGYKWSWYKDKK